MCTDKQLSRWAEHFEDQLLAKTPWWPHISVADEDLPVDCGKPTKEEIRKAVKQLTNGKAAGVNDILAEALKVAPEMLAEMHNGLLEKIWEEEEISRRNLWSGSPKKETLAYVQIIGESHSCRYLKKYWKESPWKSWEDH